MQKNLGPENFKPLGLHTKTLMHPIVIHFTCVYRQVLDFKNQLYSFLWPLTFSFAHSPNLYGIYDTLVLTSLNSDKDKKWISSTW